MILGSKDKALEHQVFLNAVKMFSLSMLYEKGWQGREAPRQDLAMAVIS